MKKVLLAIAAVATITSCSQNEEFENPEQRAEINFNTAVNHTTRAILTESSTFGSFIAYGYAHTGDFDGTVTSIVMSNATYTGSGVNWSTDGSYYWPTSGNVTFFGYAGGATAEFKKEGTTYPTLEYTVQDAINSQEDLVVAQTPNQTKPAVNATTNLTFKHALTQIYFKLKGSDSELTYSVSKIEIKNARKTGTFTYGANNTLGTWAPDDVSTANYSISLSPEQAVTGTNPVVLDNAETQIMILMPQELDSRVTIEVSYSAKKGDVEVHSSANPTSISLTGNWAAGAKIAYILTLNGDKINLVGTSDDDSWGAQEEDKKVN